MQLLLAYNTSSSSFSSFAWIKNYRCNAALYRHCTSNVVHARCEAAMPSEAGRPEHDQNSRVAIHDRTFMEVPNISISVREANLGDCWEVADTHCSAFFPHHGFPMDIISRLDRMMFLVGSLSSSPGTKRKCLVAVENRLTEGYIAGFQSGGSSAHPNVGGDREHFLEKILGILTLDTLAEFLPRRKSTGLRRSEIAYISNVAVRHRMRRRGIAKRLILEAETVARSWGSRSIALHCDMRNPAAVALYLGAGYKPVKAPAGANWPQPKPMSGCEYCLMLKPVRSLQ